MDNPEDTGVTHEQMILHDQGVYAALSTMHALLGIPGVSKDFVREVVGIVLDQLASAVPEITVPLDPNMAVQRLRWIDELIAMAEDENE